MKINIWKYIHYVLTGYFWGRTIGVMYQCIGGTESWKWCALYASVSALSTILDIIEIKAVEKKWFDDEEEIFKKYSPTLFCLNDSVKVSNEDRIRSKQSLEKLFPEKSSFEL
jgi:hypothetical protein